MMREDKDAVLMRAYTIGIQPKQQIDENKEESALS